MSAMHARQRGAETCFSTSHATSPRPDRLVAVIIGKDRASSKLA